MLHLVSFYFFGLNFESFFFFWGGGGGGALNLELLDEHPIEEMLVCPLGLIYLLKKLVAAYCNIIILYE